MVGHDISPVTLTGGRVGVRGGDGDLTGALAGGITGALAGGLTGAGAGALTGTFA